MHNEHTREQAYLQFSSIASNLFHTCVAWFGGVDTHHIFFEGIAKVNGGYRIYCGS